MTDASRRYDLVSFGETMIRLTGEAGRRLEESETLRVSVGGTESNVGVALARLGRRVAWLSALADNPLGQRIARELRGHGIDTSHVHWSAGDRCGVYFLDAGAAPRPTRVLYDRAGSAVARIDPEQVDPAPVVSARALHLTGITPALSASCAQVCLRLADTARAARVPLVFDVNYRAKLWSPTTAAAGLAPLLERASLLLCGAGDAATIWGLHGAPEAVARGLLDRSGADVVVLTLAEEGSLALRRSGEVVRQRALQVSVVDAVGAGDAFAAGFLHHWLDDRDDLAAALRSASALAALKMTIFGDHAVVSQADLDDALASMTGPGSDIVR